MRSFVRASINYLSRKLLYNQQLVFFTKKILCSFPEAEEKIRVLAYRLKKAGTSRLPPSLPENVVPAHIPKDYTPQLLFDVSELILRDVHTGIQRVVRALLTELLRNPPTGFQLRAVRSETDGSLVYAQKFCADILQETSEKLDQPLNIMPGDIFLSTDLCLTFPFTTLQVLRDQGLRVIFTIYDLFAVKLETMPRAYQLAFGDWLDELFTITDAIICDSRSVANEVKQWLQQHPDARQTPLSIGYFHLGADLKASKPTEGVNAKEAALLTQLREQTTLLMVGTVEPRKSHAPALDAMEALWKEGIQINLVIVGKKGWRSHDLVRRLRRHPQRNKQLFWLENASDVLLMQLYAQSTALLAASYAEGFGLPLIEAAYYGLPIIARDIPVFHEVAGEYVYYFPNTNSSDLAKSIQHWLELDAQGNAPQSKGMPYLTWEQSTQQLLKVILEENWYTTYQPNEGQLEKRQ